MELAEGLDLKEWEMRFRAKMVASDEEGCVDDNVEGFVDEVAHLSQGEQAALGESI
jgi:hypothetical protein